MGDGEELNNWAISCAPLRTQAHEAVAQPPATWCSLACRVTCALAIHRTNAPGTAMILTLDRTKLNKAIEDEHCTILVILDDPANVAEEIHDMAALLCTKRPWRKVFLLKTITLLAASERKLWIGEPSHYAVIGGKNRVVAVRGPLGDLTLPDSTPSAIEIQWAFDQGDRLL